MFLELPSDKVRSNTEIISAELTTKCNASCPGCPRNNFGFGVKKDLQLIDTDPELLLNFIYKFENLSTLNFCGNRGDSIAYKHLMLLLEGLELINNKLWIRLHTNGSLRSTTWWSELGSYSKDSKHDIGVIFSIDGLADTNHIYRQGTNFNKIIDNVKAFIEKGGKAEWKYLTFDHNYHQVDEARELANNLGFVNFYTEIPYITRAYNWKTGEEYIIDIPNGNLATKKKSHQNKKHPIHEIDVNNLGKTVIKNIIKNCIHLPGGIFISAEGIVYPCCYFQDEFGNYQEKFDIKTLDIGKEFSEGVIRKTCVYICR